MSESEITVFRQARTAKVLKAPPRWVSALAIGVVLCVVLAPSFFLVLEISEEGGSVLVWLLIVTGIILVSVFPMICPWFFRTLRYELGADVLTIVRAWPLSQISVSYGGITSVTRPDLEHQYGSLEAGGNPMLTVSKNPVVRMAAADGFILLAQGLTDYRVTSPRARVFGAVTDPRNLVLIEGERNCLLSPENPDEFADYLRSRL